MKPAGLPISNIGGRANMYIEQPKPQPVQPVNPAQNNNFNQNRLVITPQKDVVTPIIPKNVDPGIKPISGQEDYGVKKQDVPPPTSSKSLYFSQEKLANRTHYSSHKTPVSNSQ